VAKPVKTLEEQARVEASKTRLRNYLEKYMAQKKTSMRQLAKVMNVDHSTVSRATNPEDKVSPTLEFLLKLAKATETPVILLIAIIEPDAFFGDFSPGEEQLIRIVNRLPEDLQGRVDKLLVSGIFKKNE
jgi:transcriptional regulator with XRE-family HTH domain